MFYFLALVAVGLFIYKLVSGKEESDAEDGASSAVDYALGDATDLKPYVSDASLAPGHYNDANDDVNYDDDANYD